MKHGIAGASSASTSNQVRPSHRALLLSSIWQDFAASPWSFKLTCLYVFWEYVRPQSIYGWLQGPPWALMSIGAATAAFLAEGAKIRSRTMINTALLAFAVVVVASSLAAESPEIATKRWDTLINWLLAFLLIANTATTERRWFIFLFAYLLFNLKMSQHGFFSWAQRGFSFAGWGVSGSPGWFMNSGEFALQMGIFWPLALYLGVTLYRSVSVLKRALLFLLPVTGVGSIIASSSRGGQLALVAACLLMLAHTKRRVRAFAILAVVSPILWLALPQEQKARFSESGKDKTSVMRLKYWRNGLEMANTHPFLGVGYENWRLHYEENYFNPTDSLAQFEEDGSPHIETSHNSFVEIASQLGYLGLACFIYLIFSAFAVNQRTRQELRTIGRRGRFLSLMTYGLDAGTLSFCIAGSFMAVAFYPFLWFQLAMIASLNAAGKNLITSLRGSVMARPHALHGLNRPRFSRDSAG